IKQKKKFLPNPRHSTFARSSINAGNELDV
ncbi:unnamed protein product, partial [Rotaria sordida]